MSASSQQVSAEALRQALIDNNQSLLDQFASLVQEIDASLANSNNPALVKNILQVMLQAVEAFVEQLENWQAQLNN